MKVSLDMIPLILYDLVLQEPRGHQDGNYIAPPSILSASRELYSSRQARDAHVRYARYTK